MVPWSCFDVLAAVVTCDDSSYLDEMLLLNEASAEDISVKGVAIAGTDESFDVCFSVHYIVDFLDFFVVLEVV